MGEYMPDFGKALLAGIGGLTSGAVEGTMKGLHGQNLQQEMAIRQDQVRKYREQEADNNTPVYENDIYKSVPFWAKPSYQMVVQPYLTQGSDGKTFIKKGDWKKVNQELNGSLIGKYVMMAEGVKLIANAQAPIKKEMDTIYQKFAPILEQRKREIAEAYKGSATNGTRPDPAKAYQLEMKLKNDLSNPKSDYYEPYQKYVTLKKQHDMLDEQKIFVQKGMNATNSYVEKKALELGVDHETFISAAEGDPVALAKVEYAKRQKEEDEFNKKKREKQMEADIQGSKEISVAAAKKGMGGGSGGDGDSVDKGEKKLKKEADAAVKKLDGIIKYYQNGIKKIEDENGNASKWKDQLSQTEALKQEVLRGRDPKTINWNLGRTTKGQSKTLDSSTAMAYLSKAGGDKDKARLMAKKDGYVF
jgi:hypothetical protein